MQLLNPLGRRGGKAQLSQHFGENPDKYAPAPGHSGIDFFVPIGTPVRNMAITEGEVVDSAQHQDDLPLDQRKGLWLLGDYCIVQHEPTPEYPDGYQTMYAHLSSRLVFAGNRVSPGQLIGLSGNTGNSTGPHLHVGFRPCPYDRAAKNHYGFRDFESMICWDHDPVPAYIPRSDAGRALMGLPPLAPPPGQEEGVAGHYHALSATQEAQDRQLVGLPSSVSDAP